jgi:tetratricopeptide (TPR) repeat protein
MYIQRNPKKTSSPFRVLLLVILNLIGISIIVKPPDWAASPLPSPTATVAASFYLHDAESKLAAGDLNGVIESYEKAIKLEPGNSQAYAGEAQMMIYTEQTALALQRARKALQLAPDKVENLAIYCRALDWEGRYSEAYDACQCALESDPNNVEANAYMAEVYADLNDWIPARNIAKKAIELDYQNAEAHRNMGYVLEVQGKYRQSIEYYENAILLNPNLAPLYISAGRNYRAIGDYLKAIDRFEKAIHLNPSSSAAYDQLGWTYYTEQEFTKAVSNLETALSLDPNNILAWSHLGTAYYSRQNYEASIPALQKAITLAGADQLRKVRRIEVVKPIQGGESVADIPLLRGEFLPIEDTNALTITTDLKPSLAKTPGTPAVNNSCGQTIADNSEQYMLSPQQSDALAGLDLNKANGKALYNLRTGQLDLSVNNLPAVDDAPYAVTLMLYPEKKVNMGGFLPDSSGVSRLVAVMQERRSAPVDYYYELGLSYVYLDPPQCEKALPWLLKAISLDSSFTNPAWAGIRLCPSQGNPVPPPVPTPTPTTSAVAP